MPLPVLSLVPLVRVRFIRTASNKRIAEQRLKAVPTVRSLTVNEQHGFIDPLEDVFSQTDPDTGVGYFDLVATDDDQVAEAFGWDITFDGSTRPLRRVQVPQSGSIVETVVDSATGASMPAVWLNQLADFTGASGPVGSDVATMTFVDDAIRQLQETPDPFPQYRLDSETSGGGVDIPLNNATGNGTAIDTAAINAALAAAPAGATVRGVPGKTYLIDAPLYFRPGGQQTLDMTGCTVLLKQGVSGCNMLRNAAVVPVRSTADAAMTAGSTTLTAASAAFTSADLGRAVNVAGAGLGDFLLTATIVSVTSPTAVVLDTAAQVTVTVAALSIYNRDRNVRVTGGLWNRQNVAGSLTNTHSLMFRHVDGVRVGGNGMKIVSAAGKYAVSLADITDYDVDDIDFDTHSDGVHVMGPAYRGRIANLYGYTGDDFVAFTPNDWSTYNDSIGWVEDCLVENLFPRNANTAAILINGGSVGTGIRRIRVRNVAGSCIGNGRSLIFISEGDFPTTTGGLFDDIVVEDVNGKIGNSRSLVQVHVARLTRLRLNRINFDNPDSTAAVVQIDPPGNAQVGDITFEDLNVLSCGANPLIYIGPGVTIDRLALHRVRNPSGLAWRGIYTKGMVNDLVVRDVSGATAGHFLDIDQDTAAAGVRRATLSGFHLTATGGSLLRAITSGHTLGRLELADMVLSGLAWLADINTTTELHLSSVSHLTPAAGIVNARAAAAVTLRGDGTQLDSGPQGLAKASGAAVHAKSLGIALDASKVTTAAGNLVTNTNAAFAGGAGPLVHDGTDWQRIGVAAGAPTDIQVFTADGTWTKPAGAKTVHPYLIGGGGPGGSGRRGAAGTARGGGGAGGGAGRAFGVLRASDLPTTITVGVGVGGTGGASRTTDDTDGAAGTVGSHSYFGSYLRAQRGNQGQGGTTSGGAGGTPGTGMFGGSGGGAGGTGAAGANGSTASGGANGGGGGAGISAADVGFAGGNAFDPWDSTNTTTYTGPAGSNGTSATDRTSNQALSGGGGAGGGSNPTGNGGNGGNGGRYGGGGGGGSASANGFPSGAGTAGAPGIVVVVTEA